VVALALREENLGGLPATFPACLSCSTATGPASWRSPSKTRSVGAVAAASVARILDQRVRARKTAPRLDVILPDDPRVRELRVTPHDLRTYDTLGRPKMDSP